MSVGALVCGLIAAAGGFSPVSAANPNPVAATGPGYPGDIGPIADWVDDLINDLKGKKKKATDAMLAVGGSEGPLFSGSAASFASSVDDLEEIVDRILDPGQEPNLPVEGAGTIDTSIAPETLAEYADAIVQLATEALNEAEAYEPFNSEYIGTRLKTVQALLDEYRDLAGVN